MMIEKTLNKAGVGRPSQYEFSELKEGECMIIKVNHDI